MNLNSKKRYLPWIVCFTAALFFFYEFIQMNMFNAVSADLMQDFSINAAQLGKLSSAYFYGTLLFLPIAGSVLDRFSVRRVVLITLLLSAVGIGLFAIVHSIAVAYVARFLTGIGGAFCFLSSMRLASRWFPAERMALVAGLIIAMAMLGGVVAQTPLMLLVELLNWREALLVDAGLGFAIAAAIYFYVQDYPADRKPELIQKDPEKIGVWKSWRLAYLNPYNWCCGIYTSLMNLPVALLGAIWGNLYLIQVQHFSTIEASYVITMLFVGSIMGGPAIGWLSDYWRRRRLPMVLGALISLVIAFIIIYAAHFSLCSYLVLFFLLGFVTGSQVLGYPVVAENNPPALTATSVSVVSFSAMGGYTLFQPLFGWLMDKHWDGTLTAQQVPLYSAMNFHQAMMVLPVSFVIALAAIYTLPIKKFI